MSAAACTAIRQRYHGRYRALALTAARFVHSQTGQFRKSYAGLAAATFNEDGAPICRRTAIRGMAYLAKVGVFPVVDLGGGMRPGRNDAGQCNTWAFNPDAEALKGDKSRASKGDTESPKGLREANASLNHKTVKPRRERFETKRNPERQPRKAEPRLQEAPWRTYTVVDANDAVWLAFLAACKGHMVGTCERDLFRTWCRTCRRGADPQRMLEGWKAHLACCEARGSWTKRPDNFIAQHCYELEWPMPAPGEPSKPKDETFEQKVERRARAAGTWGTGWAGEGWDELWQRTLKAEQRRAAA